MIAARDDELRPLRGTMETHAEGEAEQQGMHTQACGDETADRDDEDHDLDEFDQLVEAGLGRSDTEDGGEAYPEQEEEQQDAGAVERDLLRLLGDEPGDEGCYGERSD